APDLHCVPEQLGGRIAELGIELYQNGVDLLTHLCPAQARSKLRERRPWVVGSNTGDGSFRQELGGYARQRPQILGNAARSLDLIDWAIRLLRIVGGGAGQKLDQTLCSVRLRRPPTADHIGQRKLPRKVIGAEPCRPS